MSERPDLFESDHNHASHEGLVESRTAQERWKLLKNVTKWGITASKPTANKNKAPLTRIRTNRSSRRNIAGTETGSGETEMFRHKRIRTGSQKNSLARTALLRSAENATNPENPENPELKKSLLAERFSIISINQQEGRNRGGESFALKRMMSTESTTSNKFNATVQKT